MNLTFQVEKSRDEILTGGSFPTYGYLENLFPSTLGSATSFGKLISAPEADENEVFGLYYIQMYWLCMWFAYTGTTPPKSFLCLYGDENNYAGLTLYETSIDADTGILLCLYGSASEEWYTIGSEEVYLMPYVNQVTTAQIQTYMPETSEKVKVNFYYNAVGAPSTRAVDMSRTWQLVYSDDPDNPIQIYRAEIDPPDGTLLATLEVDTYRDCYINIKGGYGSADSSPTPVKSDMEFYDPIYYHFMVTKPCNIVI